MVQQLGGKGADHPRPIGQYWAGRLANTWHVKGDDVAVAKPIRQWGHQLHIRANAIEKQDRAWSIYAGFTGQISPPHPSTHGASTYCHKLKIALTAGDL
jgi:hypothetical protein